MNKLLCLLFPVLMMACSTKESKSVNTTEDNVLIHEQDIVDLLVSINEPYDVSFEISKSKKGEYYLYVSIELDSGFFIASPLLKDDAAERLKISIEDNNSLHMDSISLETSNSIKEVNSITKDIGNLTSRVKLYVKQTGNFEISGFVRFMLGPKNTAEEIEFIISKQSDEIQVLRNGHKNLLPTEIMHIKSGAYTKGY
ncbi:MAG: hypothetical protein JKY48_00815 [Flavobacteriales bacterium]|nr:hypothetical protein [Flavobacteriales bacterium]